VIPRRDGDGSITILIQHGQHGDISNWLPALAVLFRPGHAPLSAAGRHPRWQVQGPPITNSARWQAFEASVTA